MSDESSGGSPGPSTDKDNKPVVDPTWNVRELVEAGKERADDLREMDGRWRDRLENVQQQHSREIRAAETARIDAILKAGADNVQRAAEVQSGVAAALAAQVTATATAFEGRLAAALEPIQRRIDDLTRAQFQAEGQKTQVVETRDQGGDNRGQATLVLNIVLGIVAVLMAALTVYAFTRTPAAAIAAYFGG